MIRVSPEEMPSTAPDFCWLLASGEAAMIATREETTTKRQKVATIHLSSIAAVLDYSSLRFGLRKGDTGLRHNPGHTQNFLVFDVRNRRNDQTHVLQKLDFAQRGIGAQLHQRNLSRQLLERPPIRYEVFLFAIVGIGIGITR